MAGPLSKPDKSGQFAQLQALLATISQTNLFYSGKLRRAGYLHRLDEFFERMPFTSKQELIDDQRATPPFGSNLTYPIERYTRLWQTSSTSLSKCELRKTVAPRSRCARMISRTIRRPIGSSPDVGSSRKISSGS